MRPGLSFVSWMSALSFLVFIPVSAWAAVCVDADNVTGPWDGKSWAASAYKTVQQGINAAHRAGGGEVWVAEGTYKTTSTTDRTISFQLKSGVALYGGFKGKETRRDQRDWAANVTVLSGDIGKTDDNSDNSYHVVVGADNATIAGFTITGGNAQPAARPGMRMGPGRRPGMSPGRGPGMRPSIGPGDARPPGRPGRQHMTPALIGAGPSAGTGGGMLNYRTSPTVANCTFTVNSAGKGGGMYNMCARTMGQRGGNPPAPTLTNCTFTANFAVGRGGGMANDLGTGPTLTNCTFSNNSTNGKGGGMYNDFGCSPTLINCIFAGNWALRGGGLANDGPSSPTLTNCTFTANSAKDLGGALYNGTHRAGGAGPFPTLTNCILWGNITPSGPKEISNWHEDAPTVSYCNVEGGYKGKGNIDADPVFVNAEGGDYRLAAGSACIDAGNGSVAPQTDKDGNLRYDDPDVPNGPAAGVPAVDIGAYERQEVNSK